MSIQNPFPEVTAHPREDFPDVQAPRWLDERTVQDNNHSNIEAQVSAEVGRMLCKGDFPDYGRPRI